MRMIPEELQRRRLMAVDSAESVAQPPADVGPKPYLDISLARARLQAVAWLSVGAVAAAEVTVLMWGTAGIVVHGLVVLAFLLGGGRVANRRLRSLLWTLAAIPTIRLVAFGAPLDEMAVTTRLLLVGGLMLLTTVLAIRATGVGRKDLGIAVQWRHLPVFVVLLVAGIGLGIAERAVVTTIPYPDPSDTMLVAMIAVVGVVDDLFFLGLLFETARRVMGTWAVPFVGLHVAVLQIGYGSWPLAACALVVTLLLAWVRQASGSLVGVILGHVALNVGLLVFGPTYAPRVLPSITSFLKMIGVN